MATVLRDAKISPDAQDFTDFAHTGPGTLAGRYMRSFWQPVTLSARLQAGRALPLRIMSQNFTLYRGEGGEVHCIDLHCAHRGTQLAAGWVEGDCIRCPYHGWKYDGTGQCVEQPLEGRESTYYQKVKIGGYPARDYLGAIFVYFGEGKPPEFPRYPEWENAKLVVPLMNTRPCNFFQNVENYVDEGHLAFTHRTSAFTQAALDKLPTLSAEETPWGVTCVAMREGRRRATCLGMPNIGMFAVHPDNIRKPGEEETNKSEAAWQEFLDYRVPIDDENHIEFHLVHVHLASDVVDEAYAQRWKQFANAEEEGHKVAQAVLRGEIPYDDIPKLCHHVPLAQDEVCQAGQGAIADRRKDVEHLGRSDVAIITLRKLWSTELKALAEGRPLRKFSRPEGMLPEAGGM
ncbi:MAG TPA: Rieske 2Fe-2S domain-containing protein [Candidatus Binatia bacterium]|nr:Rieske 2Fe-2S domain-containing protein [Candidatus Binatia bacterium]